MRSINDYSPILELNNGYWSTQTTPEISYPKKGNLNSFLLEENSFWFQHRNDIIATVINRLYPGNGIIFDIGGGNGFVSKRLQDEGFYSIVVEPGHDGVINSLNRGVANVIHSSFQNARFKNKSIPATGLFDVLEHIDEDREFLKEVFKKTTAKGYIYITVPAYKFLWSFEDDYGGHFNRYTISTLRSVLRDAGFKDVFMSYFFTFLPLPILLFKTIPTFLGLRKEFNLQTAHIEHDKSIITSLFVKASQFELDYMSKRKKIPFGASIIAVGYKV